MLNKFYLFKIIPTKPIYLVEKKKTPIKRIESGGQIEMNKVIRVMWLIYLECLVYPK